MNPVDEEAYRHFSETLNTELTQNIKPIILSLTMLAEDYRDNGQVIAQSIEEYIRKVNILFFCFKKPSIISKRVLLFLHFYLGIS
jgi:hypothetical protein